MKALSPSAGLLCKLGSLIVHYQERASMLGHSFDQAVIDQLEADPEVKAWLAGMEKDAMVPKKRTIEDLKLYAARKKGTP